MRPSYGKGTSALHICRMVLTGRLHCLVEELLSPDVGDIGRIELGLQKHFEELNKWMGKKILGL